MESLVTREGRLRRTSGEMYPVALFEAWQKGDELQQGDAPLPKSGTIAQKAEHQQENSMKKRRKKNTAWYDEVTVICKWTCQRVLVASVSNSATVRMQPPKKKCCFKKWFPEPAESVWKAWKYLEQVLNIVLIFTACSQY